VAKLNTAESLLDNVLGLKLNTAESLLDNVLGLKLNTAESLLNNVSVLKLKTAEFLLSNKVKTEHSRVSISQRLIILMLAQRVSKSLYLLNNSLESKAMHVTYRR